jgi:outer membrane protein
MVLFRRGHAKACIGTLWITLAVSVLGWPLNTQAADLLEIYHQAQESDPVFRSARFALEAARQKVPEAVSALLPSVAATGSAGRTSGDTRYTDTPDLHRGFNSNGWSVQLTQPIFRAPNIASYEESQAIATQAAAQFRQAQEDLILRVAQAYFDSLVAEEALKSATAQTQSAEEQRAAAEHGFKAGTSAVTDADEAAARAEQARSDEVAARDELRLKRRSLQKLIEIEPPALESLREDARAPRPDPDDARSWVTQAAQNSAAVLAARAALRDAQAGVFKARGQRYPIVDLTASVGSNYSSGNITEPENFATHARDKQVAIQVSVPLLDGGGMRAAIHEALANEHKAEADLETAQRQAASDAEDAYAGVLKSLAQVQALRVAVSSGESAVTGNRRGYELGIRINSDVLGAQQQLFASRRDLAKARYEAVLEGLKLKAAVGALQEEDLVAINGFLTHSP